MMESCFNDKVAKAESIVVEDLRRDLHSDLTEIADSHDSDIFEKELLQVYLRIRPFTSAEMENGESQDCVNIHPPDTVLLKVPRAYVSARLSDKSVPQTAQRFQFSQVFGPDTSQKDIFDGTVKGLVRNVLEGRNSLVFTYGITNSGKTFTFLGPENDVGILPRSLNMIFNCLRGRVFTHMSVKPQRCQDVLVLTREQQVEEALGKRNLFRLLKENDGQKSMTSLLSSKTLEDPDELDGSESERSLSLSTDLHTKFSVWVSFCEIYNEYIHDLLEQLPGNAARRTNLRLCQDIKGNSFIKDLRWVQVHSADEAFKVMKLGKRNQSISSTKLNQLSSRSHSIFSVRILRIEDVDTPRVQCVSELSLCDLAGSERCGKTQNKGDRLKEAGNINTSLLTLGKCINALRSSQHARHHIPFRESKLTHYLQGYFTGRGKACMIVNVNQCTSMYDETLNVLKFSAVAQKVVLLTTATVLPLVVKRSAREVSFIINKASQRGARRTSLLRWEHGQEHVEEDVDSEVEDEDDEEQSFLEETLQDVDDAGKETVLLDKEVYESQLMLMEELQEQLKTAKEENYSLECRVREEVSKEFSELFSRMQTDYNERILKERELVEDRCERRLEIFKNLVGKTSSNIDCGQKDKQQAAEPPSLDGMLDSMCSDLARIRQDAEEAQTCLVTSDPRPPVTLRDLEKEVAELAEQLSDARTQLSLKTEELHTQRILASELEEIKKTLEWREQRVNELMAMCVEKDDIIAKVQASLDRAEEDADRNSALIKDLLQFKHNCTCSERKMQMESRKRPQAWEGLEEPSGQPPLKKGSLKDSSIPEDLVDDEFDESPVLEVRGQFGCYQAEPRQKDKQISDLARQCQTLEFCIQELRSQLEEEKRSHGDILREKECLAAEHTVLQRSTEQQQQNFVAMVAKLNATETKLSAAESDRSKLKTRLEEELNAVRCQLAEQDCDIKEKNTLIGNLQQEVAQLQHEARAIETKHQAINGGLQRENSDLQAEVATLKRFITELEEKISRGQVEQEKNIGMEVTEAAEKDAALLAKTEALKQREAELKGQEHPLKELASRMADLAQKEAAVAEKELKLHALQKSLQETQECLREEETQSMQEVRRKEVERRRELLSVAEEAIAQKDGELQKRQDEINKLKEEVKRLTVDFNRREDDMADLREKLSDSKKQIQQVQKEISSMREAERFLKQKLGDLEKAKSQLQNELSSRDRTIQQLRTHRSDSKTDEHVQLYEKALKDLQARDRVIEDMRLALTEQEDTQTQMDLELDNRETQIHVLTMELENLKKRAETHRTSRKSLPHCDPDGHVDGDLAGAAQSQLCLKMANEKHQAERQKWLEEKMALIAQAKEAEERRNQDMRRFADDRERHARQQAEMDTLAAQLAEREQEMDQWRRERDALVSALEVQLQKLISSIAEKDKQIQQLQCCTTSQPPEGADGDMTAELQFKIHSLEMQLSNLEQPPSTREHRDSSTQTAALEDFGNPGDSNTLKNANHTRASVTSQGSCGSCPSVLDSSEISTEAGRRSRFPRPELEISFSPLQPDRFALKRQGDEAAITVKVSRAGRKRKSGEMEKDGVESENRRNLRCRNTATLPVHQEEPSPELIAKGSHDSQSSLRGRREKEGTLQKIGDFLHSSPTFLGSKAKKIMGLMSGKSPDAGGTSKNLKRSKRKLYRPNISSPMDIPAHQIIGRNPEEKDSDHVIMKRRLRARTPK
ncbi:kinesin-like protein KIF20B [Electrophorus electricus]|uniref:kinesin-like protein KIF20B n=1 Tax=Electrophorus electricus TaxID=8005 RepID=UPI0015D0C854|nr:kinesin-like protein KIF20B [Electrophorus electricus]